MHSSTHTLTSVLDGGELSDSRPGCLTPDKNPPLPIGYENG